MSSHGHEMPPRIRRLFRWLFPTELGAEACDELEAEFSRVREHHRGAVPLLWCLVQLLRPSTWTLTWELRRAAGMRDARRAVPRRHRRAAFPGSWLDVKLGYRMLRKHPVLTLIGILSISVAVGAAAGFFAFSGNLLHPTLPLDEGDRLVEIRNWDVTTSRPEDQCLFDFGVWRKELESIEGLGAYEPFQPNLILGDGRSESVQGSRITAAAFGDARVAPLLGRPLLEADERSASGDVAVIGFDLWQRLFSADSTVVGRTVRVGASTHTIVGVMPPGFRFPYDDELWVPFMEDPLSASPRDGPVVLIVLGRLSPGVTLEEAQSEVTLVGLRTAEEHPDTHGSLRPRVGPYVESLWVGPTGQLSAGRMLLVLLLIVVCANVSALVYARNATRMPEVTVRRALGASRGRILRQLFVESVLLSTLGAALGVVLTRWGMGALARIVGSSANMGGTQRIPFWVQWDITRGTLFYVAGLTLLGAVIIGVLPALKLTRRSTGGLLRGSDRHAVAPPFGRVAKVAIALQVGLSVGLLAVALGQLPGLLRMSDVGVPGLRAEQYLTARLEPTEIGASWAEDIARVSDDARRLAARLSGEGEVRQVALASAFPGMDHPQRLVEVDGGPAVGPVPVRTARVGPGFFGAMDATVVAGRVFTSGDVAPDGSAAPVAIANRSFAERLFGGANAVGRTLRFVAPGADPGPTIEIVGVVADLGMSYSDPDSPEGLYLPLASDVFPMVAVRLSGDTPSFEPRLRSLAAEVDPGLRLLQVRSLDAVWRAAGTAQRWRYLGIALATLAALGLSLTGVYAVTSFFVSQRTREIGIRLALGAKPGQIIVNILSRVLLPAVLGTALGAVLALVLGPRLGLGSADVAVEVSVAMMGAVLLACVAPLRRAIATSPAEAVQSAP
jgi:predicted permease